MHELSIVSGMLEQIEKVKLEQSWKEVNRIQIVMGPLSGVEVHTIKSCFELLTSEWRVHPMLDIIIDPIEFNCTSCQEMSLLENITLRCDYCGSTQGQIHGGRGLYFREMEGES